MIKDKATGEMRDFAFVEFFTQQDADFVMQATKQDGFSINDQNVHVTYSKVKRGDPSQPGAVKFASIIRVGRSAFL